MNMAHAGPFSCSALPPHLANSYLSFKNESRGHFLQEAFPDSPASPAQATGVSSELPQSLSVHPSSEAPTAGCPRYLFPCLSPTWHRHSLGAEGRPESYARNGGGGRNAPATITKALA